MIDIKVWNKPLLQAFLALFLGIFTVGASASESATENNSAQVMQAFVEKETPVSDEVRIAEKKKHQILFLMGAFLLLGILATASLGIAMVLFNKQVFVAHMISAGATVFLSVAHAVAAMVWFFPY